MTKAPIQTKGKRMQRLVFHLRLSVFPRMGRGGLPLCFSFQTLWSAAPGNQLLGLLHCSPVLLKDPRRQNRGQSQRLTFEERAERRSGKTKELRASREAQVEELRQMVSVDFKEDMNALFEKWHGKANAAALKVLNMSLCLNQLEIPIGSSTASGEERTLPLSHVGQLLKVSPNVLEVTLPTSAMANTAMQCIQRLDPTLGVSKVKEGGGQEHAPPNPLAAARSTSSHGNASTVLRITVSPVTTNHRDRAAENIEQLLSSFKQKAKQQRTNLVKALQSTASSIGLQGDDSVVAELTQEMNQFYEEFIQEKNDEFELLAEEVRLSELEGEDET